MYTSAWTSAEDDVVSKNYGIITYAEIANLLSGRSPKAVSHRAKQLGLSSIENRNAFLSRLYRTDVDDLFFGTHTPLSCYYAGLLAADGCIHREKGRVSIDLTEEDKDHLHQFKHDVKYGGKVLGPYLYAKSEKSFKNTKPRYRLDIRSDQWIEDLQTNFNLGPAKSLTLSPPPITRRDYKLCFMAGLLDGDGSVIRYKGYLTLLLVGAKPTLDWIRELVETIPRTSKVKAAQVRPMKTIWVYRVAGERAERLAEQIISIGLPLLPRKWVNV